MIEVQQLEKKSATPQPTEEHPELAVRALLAEGAAITNEALERLLPGPNTEPHSIHRAMRHSTFAGGKRLRPILAMEAARMVSASTEDPGIFRRMGTPEDLATRPPGLPRGAAELGAALEMLHTYSLIHDDLPALDNDDLRRGQPTCHVAFGEATAILAGDALQTLAFQTLAELPAPPAAVVAILREVAVAIATGIGADLPGALPPGMIGGQVMDLESGGHPSTPALVERIHRAKTGALITVSIVAGGLLGDAARVPPADTIARLRAFGQKAGLAFQIVDDVLDMTQNSSQLGKTAGKDTAAHKATWPAVHGIAQSRADAAQLIADAFAALAPFGSSATSLKNLAQYLVDRTH